MNTKNIIIFVIILLICSGGAYYAGTKKVTNLTNSGRGNFQAGSGFGDRGTRGGQNSGFINGSILKKDDSSITVQLRDGGSKIVYFSDKTNIGKSVDGTKDDLEIGKTVMANGAVNSDGSIVAQSIQLRNEDFNQATTTAK